MASIAMCSVRGGNVVNLFFEQLPMKSTRLKPGDWVVYRKQKVSRSPSPRALDTTPSSAGETYSYIIEKYWVVQDVLDDGQVRLCTRRGKEHLIAGNDPRLRKAPWFLRWLRRARFRAVVGESPLLRSH